MAFLAPLAAAEEEGETMVQRGDEDKTIPLPGPIPAVVVKVIDGDTIRVQARIWLGNYVVTNVRLLGVDTAEKRAHCERERELAQRAQQLLESRVAASKEIRLVGVNYDKYGKRVLARVVTSEGEDLSDVLLNAGLARPYTGGRRRSWCGDHDLTSE
jgi:endonuclease YncB( thermonuclease family)